MNKYTLLALAATAACTASAQLDLGAPFTDGAILQRGMKVPVWGTAVPGNTVTVAFAGQSVEATVAENGAWRVNLAPLATSSEGRTLCVTEKEPGFLFDSTVDTVAVKDVLVGEVWFASGQSNMECPIWGPHTRYRDMKGGFMTQMTRLPNVRYVKMEHQWSVTPFARKAVWRPFTPEGLKPPAGADYLSAVAFYYARELALALDIPIGILDASWGGTNIDAWTPRSGYANCDPSIRETAEYPVKADWQEATDRKGPVSGPNQQPTVLYNGMVAAFAPMAMRGFIWYQGCHNDWEAQLYTAKMHALYNGWSTDFENKDLKLYFVELAPFTINWHNLCAAQERFAAEEKNAALAVTADVGNFDDIHPNDKEIVAQRLVLQALKRDYGFDIPETNSPVFTGAVFEDGKAILSFKNVTNWYVYARKHSRDTAFELAGDDGVWHSAVIVNYRGDTDFVDGPTLVVASEQVPAPKKVRFMVKELTASTLYNEYSLPLGAFQSK